MLKETTAFIRNINYPRFRDYSIASILKYEIKSSSFYLTKGIYLCKHKKFDPATVFKNLFKNECLSEVLMCNKKAMSVVDFKAYVRKVPVEKTKLKTYGDMAKRLWNTFTKLARGYARIDIIFDLYLTRSIKKTKQNRINDVEGINANNLDQNTNVLLTQKYFWQIVKIKWNFSNFLLIGSPKIIMKVFLCKDGSHHR